MRLHVDQATLNVSPVAPLTVDDAGGRTLRVVEGRIWVTQQGSLDDVFLVAGETHGLDGTGVAVVTAENPDKSASTVSFDSPLTIHAGDPVERRWIARFRQSWAAAGRLTGRTTQGVRVA